MKTYQISNIKNLTELLNGLGSPPKGTTRFFRGQADKNWIMQPSIFREPYLIENEDKIIKDVLTNCPDDFLPTETLFEKLVKLQHYGVKTRLLDLTKNALVALYFACVEEEHHNKDGELIILDIPDEEIKYADSDTVAILTALSIQPSDFNTLKAIKNAKNQEKLKESEYVIERLSRLEDYDHMIAVLKNYGKEVPMTKDEYLNIILSVAKEIGENEFLLAFNEQREIIKLIHDIRTDKPSFRPVIDSNDLERVLCVRPKFNNARISKQQGSFLLYGLNESKLKPAIFPSDWLQKINGKKIIIKNKKAIIEELKYFGISTSTLFPELEKQATEIVKQYKP